MVLGPFRGFKAGATKQAVIHAALAGLVKRARPGKNGARFFTVRGVAEHFGVSICTVGAVYQRLEREGLIIRYRGSRVMVPPRRGRAPRARLRGVVALSVWLPGFLRVPDTRRAVALTRENLRRAGFVTDLVFVHEKEKTDPALAARIIRHEPDCVLFMTPKSDDHAIIETIADAGIRTACVMDRPVKTRFPHYGLSWRGALGKAFADWRRRGARAVLVPTDGKLGTSCTHLLKEAADAHGLAAEKHPWQGGDLATFAESFLARGDAGIVFDDDLWCCWLCEHRPDLAARLFSHPLALLPRAVPLAPEYAGSARVDALVMPWENIVNRVARDISSGVVWHDFDAVRFEAEWRPAVPLKSLAVLNGYETASFFWENA